MLNWPLLYGTPFDIQVVREEVQPSETIGRNSDPTIRREGIIAAGEVSFIHLAERGTGYRGPFLHAGHCQ